MTENMKPGTKVRHPRRGWEGVVIEDPRPDEFVPFYEDGEVFVRKDSGHPTSVFPSELEVIHESFRGSFGPEYDAVLDEVKE